MVNLKNSIIRSTEKLTFIFLLLTPVFNCAAQRHWFMNVGIKIGNAFGQNGGFIKGGEISFTSTANGCEDIYGFVMSYEHLHDYTLIHLGGEGFLNSLSGVSFGPTFILRDNKSEIGVSTTIFMGALLLPYYRYTYRSSESDIHEIGTFIKMIFPLQKEIGSLGG